MWPPLLQNVRLYCVADCWFTHQQGMEVRTGVRKRQALQIGKWQVGQAGRLTQEACLGLRTRVPRSRIFRVYRERMGLSHLYHPGGRNTMSLSQGYTLGNGSRCDGGIGGCRVLVPTARQRGGTSYCPATAQGSTGSHRLMMTFPQHRLGTGSPEMRLPGHLCQAESPWAHRHIR